MVTAEIFEELKELQDILVKKYDLEAKKEDAPKQLINQKDLLAKTVKEAKEEQDAYDAIQEKVSKLKVELDEAVKMREEGEKGVANSTTHREYEALEKQITEAKDKEDEVRKELQKQERDLAELDEKLKTSEELIKFQREELENGERSIADEIKSYEDSLKSLKEEEDKITPKLAELDKAIFFKFQRIIQRNTEGIVAVRNGVCEGCHMILPANFANEVREGESIKFCPYCSRILYYEEVSEDQAEDYFDMAAAGSLAGLDDDFEDEDEFDEDSEEREDSLYDEDGEMTDSEDEDLSDEENDDDSDEE